MQTIRIGSADELRWDDEADVVVVGYGGAGVCTALQAREGGAEVVAIDSFAGGGTTAYSGGVFYAGGTRFQREAGIEDSADRMFDYLSLEVGDAVAPKTLRRFCDESAADLDWLIGHGVRYASDVYLEKTTFPPEGKYLYYSGNEKTPLYAERTPPAPRGHRAVGPGYGGQYYFAALAQSAEQAGVRLHRHARVTGLVQDRHDRVVGVRLASFAGTDLAERNRLYAKASPSLPHNNKVVDRLGRKVRTLERDHAVPVFVRARHGVVLATGSYACGPEMLRRHGADVAKHYLKLHSLATLGNDGSGVELGISAGAATGWMESLYIARNIAPPEAALQGILVNRDGRRFVNEDAYTGLVGSSIARQGDGAAWLILSARSLRAAIKQATFCGWHRFKFFGLPSLINIALGGTRRAGTVKKLARTCGIDPVALQSTVDAHDRAIEQALPDPLGKNAACRARFGDGPFYAINMSLSNRFALTPFMTLGGLVVDEDDGRVLRADGSAVEGLYAAGLCAVGLHSNGYISGLSLSDGVFSGRRAGRSIVARLGAMRAGEAADQRFGTTSLG